jgi:hypothetical protein
VVGERISGRRVDAIFGVVGRHGRDATAPESALHARENPVFGLVVDLKRMDVGLVAT